MKKEKTEYLIVGAGCSGLAFANMLNKNQYMIVEKENNAGGYCRTVRRKDFVWDYAGHFFHFATPYWKNYFENIVDKSQLVRVKKNTKIYYKGHVIDYPFQKNIHQLPKEEFVDCLYDLFFRESKELYTSFQDMLYGKFGKSISDKFLIPYNEKLYACDLNELDCDAMGRFFPYADIPDIISNMRKSDNESYNDEFFYPRNGAEVFVNALLEGCAEENIYYNEKIVEIKEKEHIAYTENMEIHYTYLINTTPLNSFVRLVQGERNNKLKCNKVLVFNLGFDKKSDNYSGVHWIYFPDKDINFYRVGFYDNILGQNKLSIYVEIGYKEGEEIRLEEQLQLTLDNLKKTGIIDNHVLEESWSCVMDPAYVYLSSESREEAERQFNYFKMFDIYSIGRYGGWKYCSIEDCLVDALNLSKIIKKVE